MQKQLPIALHYLVHVQGCVYSPCPCMRAAAVLVLLLLSKLFASTRGDIFLPGELLTFSSGENVMAEVGTIHILDVGQRLLFLNKSKFNFKCTFHSL